jgi:dCMP deaminase
MNALLQCAKFGVPTEGAEIYVTHFPCLQCCKALIQSGIKTVYYAVDYKNHPYAVELFNQAKVKVVQVELEKSQDDETKQEFMSNLLDKLAETNMNKEEIQALYKKAELLFS